MMEMIFNDDDEQEVSDMLLQVQIRMPMVVLKEDYSSIAGSTN